MCGFVALFESGRAFPRSLLDDMGEDIRHRGPDAGGLEVSEQGIGLVFRRLSIIDTSDRANQPMSNDSGRCTLVFNGEIYNYRALRSELAAAGVTFATTSDSEVLLQGYLLWGEAVVERLRGMYAFVIVDRERGMAVAGRDPIGVKPLYFLERGKLRGFASEMRPFWRLVDPTPDTDAVAELLSFGWAAGGMSNVREVRRVLPGTLVRVPLGGGAAVSRRFFDILDTIAPTPDVVSEQDAARRTLDTLRDSVHAHVVSDVGYAAQLSGGVDSSFISVLAGQASSQKLRTFSVHLRGFAGDERPYRDLLMQRYEFDHHEVELDSADFADALPQAIHHMEGPVFHAGSVMLMLLCKSIRAKSKVVLTGEGADELFGGYERYALWRKLRIQGAIGRHLPRWIWPGVWPFKSVRRFAGLDAAAYASSLNDLEALDQVFPGLLGRPGHREAASGRFHDFRDRLHAVDQTSHMEALMMRQDKMSMAYSVEARVPFLDLAVLRMANALPRSVRDPGRITKPVLKRAAEGLLPRELVHRRKNGLVLPVTEWMADTKGLGRYLEALTEPNAQLATYTDRARLRTVVEKFRRGQRKGIPRLWELMNVELWLRELSSPPSRHSTGRPMPVTAAGA